MTSKLIFRFCICSLFFLLSDSLDAKSIYARRKNQSERFLSIIRPRIYQNQHRFKTNSFIVKPPSISVSRFLPCCKDESGGSMCKNLRRNDLKLFTQKCQTEPDFSLVVCCNSCSEAGFSYRNRALNFFSGKNNETNCFDRMGSEFCNRFETGNETWNNKRWSCDTSHFRLGFRVCRSTCGFCNFDWTSAPESLKCS